MSGRPTISKYDPTPGDVARFALHMDPVMFATKVAFWCGDDVDLRDVSNWFTAVANELLSIRETL